MDGITMHKIMWYEYGPFWQHTLQSWFNTSWKLLCIQTIIVLWMKITMLNVAKKYSHSIFIMGMMLLLGMFVVISSHTLTFAEIATDKSIYSKGEFIKISGIVNSQDAETVNLINIQITDLNNDNEIKNEDTPLGNNNSFSVSYDSSTWTIGEYKVIIRYNDFEDTSTFEISGSTSSNDDNFNNDNNAVDDNDTQQLESLSTNLSNTVPIPPANLEANVVSSTQIDLSWDAPDDDNNDNNNDAITGYKVEARTISS